MWQAWRAWTAQPTLALFLKRDTDQKPVSPGHGFISPHTMAEIFGLFTWSRGSLQQVEVMMDEGLAVMNGLHINIFIFHGVQLQLQ